MRNDSPTIHTEQFISHPKLRIKQILVFMVGDYKANETAFLGVKETMNTPHERATITPTPNGVIDLVLLAQNMMTFGGVCQIC